MNQIKIEKAKSWFELSKIIITIAGFMFISSGVFWTNFGNTMEYSTAVSNKALDLTLDSNLTLTSDYISSLHDLSTQLNGFAESQIDLFKTFFYSAWILVGLSLLCWMWGKHKLHKIKNE